MKKQSPFFEDVYNFIVGFCMGGANVIPGVSGGTMLFILGAFGKLTEAISTIASFDTIKAIFTGNWKTLAHKIPWRFLFGIGLGVLVSFATLAKLFVWLLTDHPQLTYGFFSGLITASIISVNRQIKKWSIGAVFSFVIAAVAAFWIISMVPVNSGSQWYMLMLYGAICIIAMILPGLSGSFLLLIFGQYDRVWNAISNLSRFNWHMDDIITVLCLGAGAIIGLGLFVHLLNWLLKHLYNATIAALIGFMVGAIPRLWPWQHEDFFTGRTVYDAPVVDQRFPWIILCAIGGLLLVLFIDFCAKSRDSKNSKSEV